MHRKPTGSPMTWPIFTWSPLATQGWDGAPMFMFMMMRTVSETKLRVARPWVWALLPCAGCTPPRNVAFNCDPTFYLMVLSALLVG